MDKQIKPDEQHAPERNTTRDDSEARQLEACIRRSREWIDRLDKFLSKDSGDRRNKP